MLKRDETSFGIEMSLIVFSPRMKVFFMLEVMLFWVDHVFEELKLANVYVLFLLHFGCWVNMYVSVGVCGVVKVCRCADVWVPGCVRCVVLEI